MVGKLEKGDPEKLRQEREKLEMEQKKGDLGIVLVCSNKSDLPRLTV